MEKSIEEYKNVIELLRLALEFYANKDNYGDSLYEKHPSPPILLDKGHQATFALERLKEFNNYHDLNDMMKSITDAIEEGKNPQEILKIIQENKKLNNADNNI